MGKKIINTIKKYFAIGALALAGATSYSGQKFNADYSENNLLHTSPISEYASMISENYINHIDKSTPFEKAREQYESNKKSELEKILNEEKKSREYLEKKRFLESYILSQDSLNIVIKEAYNNIKKWPKEFDKRLFRVLLRQESKYDVHAVSQTGYKGLGQIGESVYETFRPEKFAKLKDPITGELDEHALQKELYDPITNLELSLQYLDYISKFCAKYDKNWEKSDLDTKRKKMLFCYNAGVGKARDYDFDPNTKINSKNEKLKILPLENREYPEKIMKAYYDSNIKVKL